jgi:hypothetical protein
MSQIDYEKEDEDDVGAAGLASAYGRVAGDAGEVGC